MEGVVQDVGGFFGQLLHRMDHTEDEMLRVEEGRKEKERQEGRREVRAGEVVMWP